MDYIKIITLLLIAMGAVLMIISILKYRLTIREAGDLLPKDDKKLYWMYVFHLTLMCLFLVGYFFVLFSIINNISFAGEFFTGMIFFFGGVFVFLGILLQTDMLFSIRQKKGKLVQKVKELDYLNTLSKSIQEKEIPLNERLQKVVDDIPPIWEHPEITCAKLVVGESAFKTSNFIDCGRTMTCDIIVKDKKIGALQVGYTKENISIDEDVFLDEEQHLIDTVTKVLSNYIERVDAEKAMLCAKEVEAAVKTKSKFLSIMSHEIRTPLNAIIGGVRLLKESESPEEIRQYTDIIETSGSLLLGIINNVLDYSRIEAGGLKILTSQFCLNDIIKGLEELLKKTAENKNLQFVVQADFDLSAELIGDDIRLQQIILNLCNNAIKYTNKGLVILKIEIRSETDTNVKYKFSVIDSGIGISKENIKHLFKPFSQFDQEKNKNIEGTGLGLSIVKATLDLMKGKIGVESEPGAGSTFWFELEFKKSMDIKGKRRISDSQRINFSTIRKKLKILIADDYKFSHIVLENILKKSGITSIDIAENGQVAVDLFKVNDYDIIFMDCLMPLLNGFEATAEIRKIKKNKQYTYIIALSADVMIENEKACIDAGMDYFTVKPFKSEVIENVIRKVVIQKLQGSSGGLIK